jgi:hypothetical protein
MHQGRSLQRVFAALPAHLPGGNAMQFTVNQPYEPVPGILVSRAPAFQQGGNGVFLTRLRQVHLAIMSSFRTPLR